MKRYSQQQIQDLLDKFMNGLTTLEEEAALGDYFRTHEVPREWEDYRQMFGYFDRGMEGELLSSQASTAPLMRQMRHRWWGIAAAAAITAVIVSLTMLRPGTSTTVTQQPPVAEVQTVDTPVVSAPPAVEMQQLAVANPPKSAPRSKVAATTSRTRRLQAENAKLARENERLQRELDDLRRRAFIIDLEANGFRAVQDEDGSIVLIDLEQELENELNNQPTNNLPEI